MILAFCLFAPLKRSEYCSECGQLGCAHGAGEDDDA